MISFWTSKPIRSECHKRMCNFKELDESRAESEKVTTPRRFDS